MRESEAVADDGRRFAVDRMMGRLARWLRVLGHDVAYGPHLARRTLVDCARREGRLLLTRDTQLLRDPQLPPHLFITSDHFRLQLREVAAAVPLGGRALFQRCLECNRLLEDVSRVRSRRPSRRAQSTSVRRARWGPYATSCPSTRSQRARRPIMRSTAKRQPSPATASGSRITAAL